jgi:ATP-dependent DNA helicase RecG
LLESGIQTLKGIGPQKASLIKKEAGIGSVGDLLYYLPRRYLDRSSFKKIKDCFENEIATISGTIIESAVTGYKKKHLDVIIDDGSDSLTAVFFGGLNYFKKIFNPGDQIILAGKISFFGKKQMVHPDFDFLDESSSIQSINTGRIVPLYRSTEKLRAAGFDSRGFRRIIRSAIDLYLNDMSEIHDSSIISKNGLPGIRDAISALHFPESFSQASDARDRLVYDEIFFILFLFLFIKKKSRETTSKITVHTDLSKFDAFISSLPFQLTPDQALSIEEIKKDILSGYPMNRLLQGDVGSGKTAVSIAASLIAAGTGRQTALMAPTEILASQHYSTFNKFLSGIGMHIDLLTGGTSRSDRKTIYESLASGKTDIIIGTHALLQPELKFNKLGLIVIDEQHRFGVEQRSELRKKGVDADLLVMTATPIPRSLSLTLYGDLDISQIKTRPSNRIPVKTLAFPSSRRRGVYNSIENYISQGRQIYYVLPIIDDSEKTELKSVMSEYENLKNNIFRHRRVELLHGRMKQQEKDVTMKKFASGEIDMLVSTTVIEVGVDVPNASVIIIEHSDRFGLSQLHQLRGRVGRGIHQSFCILLYQDNISEDSLKRINIIKETDDGFEISEQDLVMRGSGELIGSKQHGYDELFEFTDLSKDSEMIMKARSDAIAAVNSDNPGRYIDIIKKTRYRRILDLLYRENIQTIIS